MVINPRTPECLSRGLSTATRDDANRLGNANIRHKGQRARWEQLRIRTTLVPEDKPIGVHQTFSSPIQNTPAPNAVDDASDFKQVEYSQDANPNARDNRAMLGQNKPNGVVHWTTGQELVHFSQAVTSPPTSDPHSSIIRSPISPTPNA